MTDKNSMTGIVIAAYFLIHEFHQFLQGFLTASDFSNGNEFTFIIYMKNRFDVQHASYHCSGSGNTAAAVQVI